MTTESVTCARCAGNEYAHAATLLWGAAGAYAVDEFDRLNEYVWNGGLPSMPIVIGITARQLVVPGAADAA